MITQVYSSACHIAPHLNAIQVPTEFLILKARLNQSSRLLGPNLYSDIKAC